MRLIPAIDLMNGQVVRARAGSRDHYRPLQTSWFPDATPSRVVAQILSRFDFGTLYCADLDAIAGKHNNLDTVVELSERFPDLEIWLDNGIKKYSELTAVPQSVSAVIGTETLTENIVSYLFVEYILSLDFKGNTLVGHNALTQIEKWPWHVIVLDLDRVGSRSGPNWARLKQVREQHQGRLYIGGGVRDAKDLKMLADRGVDGVLIADMIYRGRLDRSLARAYCSED